MPASLFAVIVDCNDPDDVAQFWATALGWRSAQRNPGEVRVSITDGPMELEVQRLVEAGARVLAVHQDPDTFDNPDAWTVLADPDGNEFCVTTIATLTGWN